MTRYDREYFEQITLGLTGNPATDTVKKVIYRSAPLIRTLMIKLFLNPQTVLDVGCGRGSLVFWLRKLGVKAYGVDISDWALENAHTSIKRYLKRGSAIKLPYVGESFDLVASFNLLEHIPEEELPKAIGECQRVAKQWTLHKVWGTTNLERRLPVADPTHVTIKPRKWWENLFANLRLKPAVKFFPKWEAGIFLLSEGCSNYE